MHNTAIPLVITILFSLYKEIGEKKGETPWQAALGFLGLCLNSPMDMHYTSGSAQLYYSSGCVLSSAEAPKILAAYINVECCTCARYWAMTSDPGIVLCLGKDPLFFFLLFAVSPFVKISCIGVSLFFE